MNGAMAETHAPRSWRDRFTPRAGVRLQLVSAAALWLVGTSFLLVRGVLFIERPGPNAHFSYAIVPIALLAIALGAIKARYILLRYADKAVARIYRRGRACYIGFFAPSGSSGARRNSLSWPTRPTKQSRTRAFVRTLRSD